jgi:hypothetical protein
MDSLIIKSTKKYIPYVNFDPESGVLEISGQCYMEHPDQFFNPIFEWLSIYLEQAAIENTTVNIKLIYFNTSAVKCLYAFFELLEKFTKKTRKNVEVNWFFDKEDDSMLEAYHEYKEQVKLPFTHIQIGS